MREITIDSKNIVLREAAFDEIVGLREAVIIAGTDRNSPEFSGDHDETTHHFGAFNGEANIGCLTMMLTTWADGPAWQLRGMATTPEHQGKGAGRELLHFTEQTLGRDSGIRQFWCNARLSAVGFYQKQGWSIASEQFVIAGVGPHHKMAKTLEPEKS